MPVSLDTIKSPRLQQGSAAGKGNIYIILYVFYIYTVLALGMQTESRISNWIINGTTQLLFIRTFHIKLDVTIRENKARLCLFILNKTPAEAFTPPADEK